MRNLKSEKMAIPIKIKALLWFLNRQKGPQLYELDPAAARAGAQKTMEKVGGLLDYKAIELEKVEDKVISVRDGEIPIRIYHPSSKADLPVIMYFHGGGFVMRSIDSHDKVCRRICRDNDAIIISVGYRLAPEFKFPTPVHDCYDATVWASKHALELGGDSARLLVMGDSAGANLSTAVCLMSRDQGGPKISYQILIYPCTDGYLSAKSITSLGEGYFLTKKMMEWFIDHYKSSDADLDSPYLSVLLAEDLSNLPPTFLFTAEYDPLKDEGKAYADRLREAGNEVLFKEYEGMIHGFISMPKMSKRILGTYEDIRKVLKEVIA